MAHRVCAGLVASAAAAAFLRASLVNGHCHQQFPMSRQYARSRDFYDFTYDLLDGAPYAYNAGGVKEVQDRARRLTDPDVLAAAGNGDQFPLYYMERAANGNYLETNEIAKRHGVCGDPRLGFEEDEMPYSTPNSEWEVIDTFESGQVIEIDVVVVYYHWGHFEFFLCDVNDLDRPDGVVTQECLNKYPLTREYNANDASVIDPNYPGRYYVDPPCRKDEVEQNVSDNIPANPYNVKMRYRLPDIECDHCVLQMHYLTGNRCKHIGYNEFDPPSWNSECAPTTDKWIDTDMSICGEGQSYPEEFWGCSDIAITSSSARDTPATSPTPSPVSPETPSPVTPATPSPVSPDTAAPVTPATPSPVTPEITPSPVTPETPSPITPATPSPTSPDTAAPVTPATSSPVTPTMSPTATEVPIATPTEDTPMCSNGVPGLESSSGAACCAPACRQCGGDGCWMSSADLGLTSVDCCEGTIVENGTPCGEAPCVIATTVAPETTPSPVTPKTPSPVTPATPSPVSPGTAAPVTPATPSPATPATLSPVSPDDTVAPVTPTAAPVAEEPVDEDTTVCSNGIPGIQSSDGTACCMADCGKCGGLGCEDNGRADDCCISLIVNSGMACSVAMEAPCYNDEDVIEPTPTMTAAPTEEPTRSFSFDFSDDDGVALSDDDFASTCSNGVEGIENDGACCVLECGRCGGIGCAMLGLSRGLGAADCCSSTILDNNKPCGEAPCVIPAGNPAPTPVVPDITPASPTVAPATPVAPAPVEPPTEGKCSNGVKGIEFKGVCCVLECGICGGVGCSTIGASLGLGAADCCLSTILSNDEPCGEAPCVVTPIDDAEPTPGPVPEPVPGPAPTAGECSGGAVGAYEQCGGSSWKGSTCCPDGYECTMMGQGTCYAQCRPSA